MAPKTSVLTAAPSLPSRDWKGFRLDTGSLLLHVPSSHVFAVDDEVLAHVRGERPSEAVTAQLAELEATLPKPVRREVRTSIEAASLNMAQGCNLRCTYCFAGEGDYGSKGMMTLETAKAALELLSRGQSRFHVIFFGGEPMLNFAVIQEVVAWCEEQPVRYTFGITTNGTLLTAEKLAWLKEKGFAITWSYDGKGLHGRQRLLKDKQTGSDTLVERKMQAFDAALRDLKDFKLRATVTREHLHLMEEAIATTLDSKAYKLYVSRHTADQRSNAFTNDDVERYCAILKSLVDRHLEAKSYETLLKLSNFKDRIKAIHRGQSGRVYCGAGLNYLTVSVEGNFYLCHRFNEDESERFGGIQDGLDEARLAGIREARSLTKDPCRSCWMREWCAGGCFHEHKAMNGDILAIDRTFCRLQAIEIEQALRIYARLKTDAPHLIEA